MSEKAKKQGDSPQLVTSARPYFSELLESAVQQRKLDAPSNTRSYLVGLLEHYTLAVNLFESGPETGSGRPATTLAERLLTASNAEPAARREILKRLGDSALYISGFFGDSLHRKIVDLDYYAEMGGTAYGSLATEVEVSLADTYRDLARRFLDYVEVLTYISQQTFVQTDADLLRLYNRYLITGSRLAQEQLIEKGVLAATGSGKLPRQ